MSFHAHVAVLVPCAPCVFHIDPRDLQHRHVSPLCDECGILSASFFFDLMSSLTHTLTLYLSGLCYSEGESGAGPSEMIPAAPEAANEASTPRSSRAGEESPRENPGNFGSDDGSVFNSVAAHASSVGGDANQEPLNEAKILEFMVRGGPRLLSHFTHTETDAHRNTNTRTHLNIYIYVHTHKLHSFIHTYIHTYTRTYAHATTTYMHAYIHTFVYAYEQ